MLQRPPTIKEFVIRSILGWREAADTIVDCDDEAPTAVLGRDEPVEERVTEVDPMPPPRASQDSIVFDLVSPPA
jgi:hypothetical protein